MAYLILDLDLTTFVTTDAKQYIDEKIHTLSNEVFTATTLYGNCSFPLQIINPKELAELITIAFTEHDGLLILSSGAWDPMVRNLLANALDLSEQVKEQLRHCHFHSILTDINYFKLTKTRFQFDESAYQRQLLETIRYLGKNSRLNYIIDFNPELSSKEFVLLDDDLNQLKSFNNTEKVDVILAATRKPDADKKFYERAKQALVYAKAREQNKMTINDETQESKVSISSNASYSFFFQQLIIEEEETLDFQNHF